MKLAEALQERADLRTSINSLKERICNSALVQEGEESAENPQELLNLLKEEISKEEKLVAAINLKNCITKVADSDYSLTQLIAKRDGYLKQAEILREIINIAAPTYARASMSEIKILRNVDIKALQSEVDELAKKAREANNQIQQTNWTVDL